MMWPSRLVSVCALVLLSLLTMQAGAQAPTESVTLQWEGQAAILPTRTPDGKVPTFAGASIDPVEGLPYYRLQLPGVHASAFQLTEPQYQPFSAAEQQLFGTYRFPAEPQVHVRQGMQNKVPASLIAILPVRLNPGSNQLEKLVSFRYTYTSGGTNATNARTGSAGSFATNSVLSTGDWYKLAVTASGVYKIDKSVLQTLGLSTQSIDPKKIQVFGNGGGMLPQPNSAPRPDDLVENAIWVAGETDGKFDDADYALFYAQGPHTWAYNETQEQFEHTYNLYSDTAYYFLRVNHSAGMRVASASPVSVASQTISTYNERLFHEKDLKNMVYSGREWYGEDFSSFAPSRSVSFAVSDAVPNATVKLTAALMANSPAESSFSLRLNDQALGSQTIPSRGTYNYHPEGTNSTHTYSIGQQKLGNVPAYEVKLTFSPGGSSSSVGYLNYLELAYERQLKLYGEQTSFRSLKSLSAPVSDFRIAGAAASATVWDVTEPQRPEARQFSNGSFSAPTATLREFVVFEGGNISTRPTALGKVANQNLHRLNEDGSLDFVIVAHPAFLQEANRLAAHRAQHSNMRVEVVTPGQIFNEFSSGAQDVTAIRDFMRMVHSRSAKRGDEALYLLLFGDASYDYKDRSRNNTNFVPIYESRQSLHPIASYSSEDYYGFLDADEGEWAEDSFGDHLLDIGIGRLPVKSAAEAATVVDKIIAYDSPSHFGGWRSKITFMADDGDYNEHQKDAEYLANYIESTFPVYTPNKIYVDLYPQQALPNGQRVPAATAAINKAVEQGSLIMNYTGHGNEVSLAEEQILTLQQIKGWTNKENLTFILTATCEFGRYDDPARTSGAEIALLHEGGGAVGLVTTTRPVYSNGNRVLNRNFFKSAFTPLDGRMPRLGDLVLHTKNNSITDNVSGSTGVNNRNFSLLSDPSLQLAYPKLQVQLTHINGVETATDTLSALGKVTLQGQVVTGAGSLASDFSGDLRLTVYEKSTTRYTLGDENSQVVPVQVRENVIYDGKASVQQGQFTVTFVVPKDIAYNYGTGKIALYASNSTSDAMGANQSVVIGGTATNVPTDNTPPTVNLYMDDESFANGGSTGKTTVLLANLFDDNGINTAGLGIGHEITAILDENRDNVIVLNDYYTATQNNYQKGQIKYTLKDLEAGPHSVRLKAWDTHNNSSEEYIEFFVSNDANLALEHVLNYPNPFSTHTTFHFDHNRAGENLDIQVQIYTISGKLIKTLQTTSYASKAHVADLSWNGRDEYNDTLARGVYVYRMSVRSQQDGSKTSKFDKLVILN
ncbi:type IX secretion system sortase PorU [Pontibacter sp. E15-1]|uniref:type IX secretion system sortase PorU n=1 Tax=Pontibacter sp. E15-1 TaxID=2919918 RepID=UPI001F4FBAA5|nr:type IX secretion system sortase PorU [Pontibacter sp. E15-1]MCJ8165649.1 type IX secretion system sortase PorU [Pontibacter sp. E15-1]